MKMLVKCLCGAALVTCLTATIGLAQSSSLRVSAQGATSAAGPGVVAGQRFRANAAESHEVVLPDGTSVVIGAGGAFRVGSFNWNGRTGSGMMQLSPGTYRISAGGLGSTLSVMAGTTLIQLQNATSVISVDPNGRVTVYMTVGGDVTVSKGGACPRRLVRAGFATTMNAGECASRARRVSAEVLAQDRSILRPARRVATEESRRTQPPDSERGIFVPAAAEGATDPAQDAELRAAFEVNELIQTIDQQNREAFTPEATQVALLLAPGITVPVARTANVTGDISTQTDGRVDIPGEVFFDNEGEIFATIIPFSTLNNFPDPIGDPIFDASPASNAFFSNEDAPPLTGDAGFRSYDLRVLDSVGSEVLYPREVAEAFSIGELREIRASGDFNDILTELESQEIDSSDPFFDDYLETVVGDEISVDYFQIPANEVEFGDLLALDGNRYPFEDGVGAAFRRSTSSESDDFVLFHYTEAIAGSPDPTGQSSIFATGRISDQSRAFDTFRVERYASSFGLFDITAQTEAPWPGFAPHRALLPDISRQASGRRIALADEGIYFVYAAQDTDDYEGVAAQVAHADLGFFGSRGDQVSSLSISTGGLRYGDELVPNEGNRSFPTRVADLSLHSFGTLRNSPAGVGAVLVSSPLESTSSGGGNQNLRDDGDLAYDGLAGYFLLETDPTRGAGSVFAPMNPQSARASFETIRLLYATGAIRQDPDAFRLTGTGPTPSFDQADRDQIMVLTGFAAGLAEVQSGGGTLTVAARGADAAEAEGNLRIETNPATNRVVADMTLSGPSADASPIAMGGLDATDADLSAYVDRFRLAARTGTSSGGFGFAMASSHLVTTGVSVGPGTGRLISGLGSGAGTILPEYEHIKWGVFLGDRLRTPSSSQREHIHIGSWVAGDPVDADLYEDFTGEASYSGHTIGNAFDGASVYTAIGTYSNTWDFGNRTGSVVMEYDGATYRGDTQYTSGSGFESTNLSADGRGGGLDGNFYGGISTGPQGTSPNAVGGQFSVSNTVGAPTYQATGTFAAEKQ